MWFNILILCVGSAKPTISEKKCLSALMNLTKILVVV